MIKRPGCVPSLKFLLSHPAHIIAGGFGSGYSPITPGTTGTLFAWASYLLIHPLLSDKITFAAFLIVAFAVGVWACHQTGRDLGVVDHGSIVWDEVVPFWGVLWFVSIFTSDHWGWQLTAFVLFRIFDIVKPQPAKYFDEKVKNGFGVMMDDFFAAIYTLLGIVFALRLMH